MKNLLFFLLFCLLFGSASKAQDSLIFDNQKIRIVAGGRSIPYPYKDFTYFPSFASKYQIKVQNQTIWEGLLSDLRFQNATTLAQKLAVLESKIGSYNYPTTFTSSYANTVTVSGSNTAIPTSFFSGSIAWANVGTGTVTITNADGSSTVLNATNKFSGVTYPPQNGLKYTGITVAVAGGAVISWTFSK